MSTKIYEAWKIPARKFPKFLGLFTDHCWVEICDRAGVLMGQIQPNEWKESKYYVEAKEGDTAAICRAKVERAKFGVVIDKATAASATMWKDDWCLDMALQVWYWKGYFYVIPCGETPFYRHFKVPRWAKYYGYWNNTDQGPDIEFLWWKFKRPFWMWELRGERWNKVMGIGERNQDEERVRMIYYITNLSDLFSPGRSRLKWHWYGKINTNEVVSKFKSRRRDWKSVICFWRKS